LPRSGAWRARTFSPAGRRPSGSEWRIWRAHRRQLDAINNDPEANAKLNKNNPKFDASLAAKRNRLIDAVAHYKAQAAKE
jgi:hypothetical protein